MNRWENGKKHKSEYDHFDFIQLLLSLEDFSFTIVFDLYHKIYNQGSK